MNKLRFLVTILLIAGGLFGITKPLSAQKMPAFKMTLADNKVFAATDLQKNKPIVLIYFDPDCEHCQKLMEDLFRKIDRFSKTQIVMVTYKPLDELPAFQKLHSTARYKNIVVGTEGVSFYLRNFYGLEKMPFVALYDKHQNLNYYYKEQASVDDLVIRLNKLK